MKPIEKAETVAVPFDPFPNARPSLPSNAKPVTPTEAQAISAALKFLAEKRAAAEAGS